MRVVQGLRPGACKGWEQGCQEWRCRRRVEGWERCCLGAQMEPRGRSRRAASKRMKGGGKRRVMLQATQGQCEGCEEESGRAGAVKFEKK